MNFQQIYCPVRSGLQSMIFAYQGLYNPYDYQRGLYFDYIDIDTTDMQMHKYSDGCIHVPAIFYATSLATVTQLSANTKKFIDGKNFTLTGNVTVRNNYFYQSDYVFGASLSMWDAWDGKFMMYNRSPVVYYTDINGKPAYVAIAYPCREKATLYARDVQMYFYYSGNANIGYVGVTNPNLVGAPINENTSKMSGIVYNKKDTLSDTWFAYSYSIGEYTTNVLTAGLLLETGADGLPVSPAGKYILRGVALSMYLTVDLATYILGALLTADGSTYKLYWYENGYKVADIDSLINNVATFTWKTVTLNVNTATGHIKVVSNPQKYRITWFVNGRFATKPVGKDIICLEP